MTTSATQVMENAAPSSSSSPARAILYGAMMCAALDITAACVQAGIQFNSSPPRVLKGVAAALLGRTAYDGGPAVAAMGLAMHCCVATSATVLFYLLSRRFAVLRQSPVLMVGPLYGLAFFSLMNFGTLPFLSFVRSLYLNSVPYWVGPMRWPQALIHMVCVGLPIVWCNRRFGPR